MKTTKTILCIFAIFGLCFVQSAAAATDPADVLKELAGKIKTVGTPEPVIDYVYWPEMYDNLSKNSPQSLKAMNVNSADELKSHFQQIFKDPGEWVNAGEKIMRIAPLSRLRVHGTISAQNWDPL